MADPVRPKLVLALGRGRTGKSCFTRWAAERAIEMGGELVIADGDRQNATLSAFFANVTRPPSRDDADVTDWLNGLVERQIEERFSAFLDLGGADQIVRVWADALDLAGFLDSHSIDPVALYFLGPDLDDLAYVRDAEFQPTRTAVILNEGVVPLGRTPRTAFDAVTAHAVFKAAEERGALVLKMPRLLPMHEVELRRLNFADAIAGATGRGLPRIGPVNRQLISMWRREMETAFAPIAQWIC